MSFDKKLIIALVSSLVDDLVAERLEALTPTQGPRGLRGAQGKDFIYDEHREVIEEYLEQAAEDKKLKFSDLSESEKQELKLKFDDLSLEERLSLVGPKGKDGKTPTFEEVRSHVEEVFEGQKENLKLKFSDLSEEEISLLKGEKGESPSAEEISKVVLEHKDILKLTFDDLTEEQKLSLKGDRGARGPRGQKGKDFQFDEHKEDIRSLVEGFISEIKQELKPDLSNEHIEQMKLKFSDLSEEDKNALKLKFSDLSDADIESLKVRGPRGQRGARGFDGKDGVDFLSGDGEPNLSAKDGDKYLDNKTGNVYQYEKGNWSKISNLKGPIGPMGPRGMPGASGVRGIQGKDGRDGKDAAEIVRVEIDQIDNRFYFIFFFSDGRVLETDYIDLPEITQKYGQVLGSSFGGGGGGGGGGISGIQFLIDSIAQGIGTKLDVQGPYLTGSFSGDTFTLGFDETQIPTPTGGCVEVKDEGNLVTDCVKGFDFEGSLVEVLSSTTMADWPDLDTVDFIGTWESNNPGYVKVKINNPIIDKLEETKTYSENISALKLVTAISDTHVKIASNDTYSNSKVMGVARQTGATGFNGQIHLFGKLEDASFIFPVNDLLFLGPTGSITNIAPTVGFSLSVGYSLGNGAIFVKIGEPIAL